MSPGEKSKMTAQLIRGTRDRTRPYKRRFAKPHCSQSGFISPQVAPPDQRLVVAAGRLPITCVELSAIKEKNEHQPARNSQAGT
ncbi:hypothetical protein V5799_010579, partial [Amblyomma americanum]